MTEPPSPPNRARRRIPPLDAANAEGPLETDRGKATSELFAFSDKTLEQKSRENEHHRNESLKDTVHWLFSWGVKVAFTVYGFAVGAVVWHYLMPEQWGWLSQAQLHTVATVVFSGAVISNGGQYLSRRVR